MDRDQFIAGLKLSSIRPQDLVTFFRGLPRRVPGGSGDEQVAARENIEQHLSVLNAHTLGREPDLRVPVDVEEISAQLADRLGRFSSADWGRGSPTLLDASRQSLAEILFQIRLAKGEADDADPDEDDD